MTKLREEFLAASGGRCIACRCADVNLLTWIHAQENGKKRNVGKLIRALAKRPENKKLRSAIVYECSLCVLLCVDCIYSVQVKVLSVASDGWFQWRL